MTFVPATKPGVDVPVPPLATGSVPVIPVDSGKPVQLVNVPLVGVPRMGVTSVGDVERTLEPDPVEVVTPVPPLATASVPVTPVDSGKPVQLVSVPLVGVPRMGVTSVGDVARTFAPDPVEVVTPVPPLATASVPATVTIPLVAVLGVKPVEPKEIVVTPPPPVPFATQLVTPEVSDDRTYPEVAG